MHTAWHHPEIPELEKLMPITLFQTAALALTPLAPTGTGMSHDVPTAAATATVAQSALVTLFQKTAGPAKIQSKPTRLSKSPNHDAC